MTAKSESAWIAERASQFLMLLVLGATTWVGTTVSKNNTAQGVVQAELRLYADRLDRMETKLDSATSNRYTNSDAMRDREITMNEIARNAARLDKIERRIEELTESVTKLHTQNGD